MSAIAKSTESNLDALPLPVLAEVANNAAENVETNMRSAVQNAIASGKALIAAKSQCAHGQWLDWLKENWGHSKDLANDYMTLAKKEHAPFLDSPGSVREALRMIAEGKSVSPRDEPEQSTFLDEEGEEVEPDVVVDASSNEFECKTCGERFVEPVVHCDDCGDHFTGDDCSCHQPIEEGDDVEYEDVEDSDGCEGTPPHNDKPQEWLTIEQWNDLDDVPFVNTGKKFNKQDTTSIEWAQWSWNPITGCKHDCPYCYARDIANRFYEQKFEPSIYPARFSAPENTKVPDAASDSTAHKNVFTGSMADIFGRWVPDEWVQAVLDVVAERGQWNFLFLTKFPQRIHEFGELPSNAWMGTSVDCQARVSAAEKAFAKMGGGTKWLSVEPMLTPLKFDRLDMFDWVVIGGASRSSTTPAWVPPFDWIADLHQQARDAGCAIYHKDNLQMGDDVRLREFPWDEAPEKQLPESMKYLGM